MHSGLRMQQPALPACGIFQSNVASFGIGVRATPFAISVIQREET